MIPQKTPVCFLTQTPEREKKKSKRQPTTALFVICMFSSTATTTVKALEKCRDMQERMTLVLKDMTERLASDLIAPLTVFVEEQGGSVKEACRKVDKTQEKRRHASLNPSTNALSLAKSSTISKTDQKALELVSSFCNAASLECIRMFTLLFKSSSFVFPVPHTTARHRLVLLQAL